jgi:lipid-A-disaccharide synthase
MSRPVEQQCIMIIAGEASGDLHGSHLVKAMRKKDQSLFFCGIGGQALKDAGTKILFDASRLAVVGITEVFSKIPDLLKGMTTAKRVLKTLRPDLLILIDFPDFNFHIAAAAKKIGIPVLYYISPQVWAWRSGRVKKIKELVDHMAVILPFEEDYYREHKIPATFVGHPLLDTDFFRSKNFSHACFSVDKALEKKVKDFNVIGLLPGSRDKEISRHLPEMISAANILSKRKKNIKFIISVAPSAERSLVEGVVKRCQGPAAFELVSGGVDKVLERCDLVIAASGTVTLEAGIFGTPMIIVYKMSPVSYWLGRAMIEVKNVGLVNLIAGEEIVPELLQGDANPEKIADKVFGMLNDPAGLEEIRKKLLGIRDVLGGPGASERVADIAISMLR